jgi:TonB family protein
MAHRRGPDEQRPYQICGPNEPHHENETALSPLRSLRRRFDFSRRFSIRIPPTYATSDGDADDPVVPHPNITNFLGQHLHTAGPSAKPKPTGTLNSEFVINDKGHITSAKLLASTLKHEATQDCVLKVLRRWRFPKIKNQCGQVVTVVQPLVFKYRGKNKPKARRGIGHHC